MVRHIKYVGNNLELKNRSGVVLEANPNAVRCLFLTPFNVPAADVRLTRNQVVSVDPDLAYPPINKGERFEMYGYSWSISEAWRLITKARPTLSVPVEKVDVCSSDLPRTRSPAAASSTAPS